MKITIVTKGGTFKARLPYKGADSVFVSREAHDCPETGGDEISVYGGTTHNDHDTHYAKCYCRVCGESVGQIQVKVKTLFGIDEDRAVLQGRPRVY